MAVDKSVVSRVERDKTKGHVKLAEMGSKQGPVSLGESHGSGSLTNNYLYGVFSPSVISHPCHFELRPLVHMHGGCLQLI